MKASEKKKNYVPTKETREKIGEAVKGHHMPEESKEKIRKANSGKKFTEEHRKKLSEHQHNKRKVYFKKVVFFIMVSTFYLYFYITFVLKVHSIIII